MNVGKLSFSLGSSYILNFVLYTPKDQIQSMFSSFRKIVPKSHEGNHVSSEKEKRRRNRKKCCRCLCCIPNLIICNASILTISLIIIGISGFTFFLSESIRNSENERKRDFGVIVDNTKSLLTKPKIMADTMSAAIESGLLNYSTSSFESIKRFAFLSLYSNFERFEMDRAGMGIADTNVDKYFSFSMQSDGSTNYLRRFVGYDNTSLDEIYLCTDFSAVTYECEHGEDGIEYWNSAGSITTRSKYIYTPQYVTPYPFYCPGTKCDLYLSYTSPVHMPDGSYLGMSGFYFTSTPSKVMLIEYTEVGTSYIVDINTGYLFSASSEDVMVMKSVNGYMTQILAHEHDDDDIRGVTSFLRGKYDVSALPTMEHMKDSTGTKKVDFLRYREEGIDFLIVRYFPSLQYYTFVFVFSLTFSFILFNAIFWSTCCCCCITCYINESIRRLKNKMKKVETLDLQGIKKNYSYLGEVNSLEDKFYFLIDRLEEYVAFLPQFLSDQNAEMKDTGEEEEEEVDLDEENVTNGGSTTSSESCHSDELQSHENPSSLNHVRSAPQTPLREIFSEGGYGGNSSLHSLSKVVKIRRNKLTSNRIEQRYCTIVRICWVRSYSNVIDGCLSSPTPNKKKARRTRRRKRRTERSVSCSPHRRMAILSRKNKMEKENFDHLFSGDFVDQHTLLTELIFQLSYLKGGTMTLLNDHEFQIAFNLNRPCTKHWDKAGKFALDAVEMARKKGFHIVASVVTDMCCSAVLGCSKLKNVVIVGKIIGFSERLTRELMNNIDQLAREEYKREMLPASAPSSLRDDEEMVRKKKKILRIQVLTNKVFMNLCNLSASSKNLKITPYDVVYYPTINEYKPHHVFTLERMEELRDTEWMYQLEHKKKMEIQEKILTSYYQIQNMERNEEITDLLKTLEFLRKVEKLEPFQKCIWEMMKQDKSFNEVVKSSMEEKREAYEKIKESSIFQEKKNQNFGEVEVEEEGEDGVELTKIKKMEDNEQ